MAAFLFRAAGSPGFTPPATPTFLDVPRTSQFFTEIEWLAQTGITTGWPDGTFRPNSPVERQAMAAFLYRAFNNGHLDDTHLNRP
ncbi:MAG: S-layer homology domain-containing protein, partial [Promicromonosporaceae bacterium]|nr:S-layer homology domain-containing protein [Promicromonosporaceae bacterium]MCL2595972.1 S-layer homology domain-containing protein [Promicromonosporaceae bacterium]